MCDIIHMGLPFNLCWETELRASQIYFMSQTTFMQPMMQIDAD